MSAGDHKLTGRDKYLHLDSHAEAISLQGLGYVLRTMQWADLETLAMELEGMRKSGKKESRAAITASIIDGWARS